MTPTSDQTRAVWDRIAVWWDAHIGEGNDFQKNLIMPATDRLLDPRAGQTILDIACGNGNYSRRLAQAGAHVVACDFSESFLDRARAQTRADHGSIDYRLVDATNPAQLLSLGQSRFDSAVCSMAMMDMPTIHPLLQSLPKLLKPSGHFVFSLPHPCFHSNEMKMTAALEFQKENVEQVFGVEVRRYLSEEPGLSVGIINQPEPHHFFHRPLSSVFAACFQAGFVIDGCEEPAYPPKAPSSANAFSWAKRPDIPPAIVIRIRPVAK
jgi:2-polyprenyl-3-methyl-5-hydroxy-6-metoxy-1,4-benzoquinol methylase